MGVEGPELKVEPLVLQVAQSVLFGTFVSVAKDPEAVGVGPGFLVRQHRVAGDAGRVARDKQLVEADAVRHIVVLAAPAPEEVREAVHFDKVVHSHGADAAK